MQPLVQLLHRIRWDAEFGKGEFALAYYDRVLREETIVPLASVALDAERPETFTFTDDTQITHRIPLHRVRAVYRDGVVIWRRPNRAPAG